MEACVVWETGNAEQESRDSSSSSRSVSSWYHVTTVVSGYHMMAAVDITQQ